MAQMKTNSLASAVSFGVAMTLLSTSQVQARALEEVVVTAQKRAESLQDVPISVSAVSGDKLSEASITEVGDLTALVPNFTMNETGIGTNISIRGISSGINPGFEQSVGMYVDGVYYGRAQLARAPFLDLERIEVLRGPQSILFGKNSIAGAVSMIAAKPTDEFEGSITALYEPDHGEVDTRLVLSGPLSEDLSGRLAVLYSEQDGFFENTTLGRDEPQEEEFVVRGTLDWQINDALSASLKVENGSFDSEGRFLEIINPTTLPGGVPYPAVLSQFGTTLDTDQDFRRQSSGDSSENDFENVTLNVQYDIGEHRLDFTTGYLAYDFEEICDCDFIGANIFNVDGAEDFEQFSQEVRLTSPVGEKFEYIVGGFYQSNELTFDDAINIPTNSILPIALAGNPALAPIASQLAGARTRRSFSQDGDTWAVFAQGTWNITDEFRLTLGGRYTSEDKQASRRQFHVNNRGMELGSTQDPILNTLLGLFRIEPYDTVSGDRDESVFTPLLNLEYDISDSSMLYASYTTGFKAGGFDVRSNANPNPAVNNATLLGSPLTGSFEYEEEEAKSIELGGKFSIGSSAELNVALYSTEYTDLQTSQFDGTLGFNVTNAGEATVRGLEMDGRWQVTDSFLLSGGLAYLDFEYDSFPNGQCFFGQIPNSPGFPGLCDVTGERREFTPEYTATLTGDYETSITDAMLFRMTVDLSYSDDYLISPTLDPRLVQDSYVKVDARIALASADDTWEVALIGRNLTDEAIATFGNQAPVSTTLTRGTGTAYYAFYERPSSVAIQASYRF